MLEVVLALAAAIVKTAFKFWTKDSELARNTTDELTDLMKDKIVGTLGQRKARRWVEDLEVIVNTKLHSFLDHEFAGLTDNERQATILAVADTFTKADISNQIILDQDLDPLHLASFMKVAVPNADRDLGEEGRGLYTLLLAEASAYVVSLIASLPSFQVGVFTELLRRDTAIIATLDEILKLLPQQTREIDLKSRSTDAADEIFVTAYRRQVVTKLDHLQLFGVDAFTRLYPLSLAYINLSVVGYRSAWERQHFIEIGEDAPSLPIQEVLAKSHRIFLKGRAGSGKTTILQWLAVRSARKDYPQFLGSWNNFEPFFVPLRRYVDKDLPSPSQFVEALGKHVASGMPKYWVETKLVSGSALILIDGIDELPASKYQEVRSWIRELIRDYPHCAYVITSRPGAIADDWLIASDFSEATLAPMSSVEIQAFVSQWIDALSSETVDREERDQLEGFKKPISTELLTKRHLRELAATPLLCALLCALYYARHGQLPMDRMGVYAAAFDMLERRDAERDIRTEIQIGRAESRLILQDIAFWLMRNSLSDADVTRVIEQVARSTRNLHKVQATSFEVYRHLLLRSGLLQEPTADRVGFIHRTFEEYLAAKAAIDGDNLEELIGHALDLQWTQVIIMAAGHASRDQRIRLISSLLDHRRDRKHSTQYALLALACLETSPSVPAELVLQIGRAAETIIPPNRREDADALVRAGEMTLDLLYDAEIQNSWQALFTLQVIARLEPERERRVSLIARILEKVPLISLGPEFCYVWEWFDPSDVAQALNLTPSITGVQLLLPRCRKAIPMLTRMERAKCYAQGAIPDLACFRDLPQLRVLVIHSTGVVDLTPLAGMADLAVDILIAHENPYESSRVLLRRYVVGADELGPGSSVQASVDSVTGQRMSRSMQI